MARDRASILALRCGPTGLTSQPKPGGWVLHLDNHESRLPKCPKRGTFPLAIADYTGSAA